MSTVVWIVAMAVLWLVVTVAVMVTVRALLVRADTLAYSVAEWLGLCVAATLLVWALIRLTRAPATLWLGVAVAALVGFVVLEVGRPLGGWGWPSARIDDAWWAIAGRSPFTLVAGLSSIVGALLGSRLACGAWSLWRGASRPQGSA